MNRHRPPVGEEQAQGKGRGKAFPLAPDRRLRLGSYATPFSGGVPPQRPPVPQGLPLGVSYHERPPAPLRGENVSLLDCFASLAMTRPAREDRQPRHCEEQSDEAIQPGRPSHWIASLRSQ
jgi:hypothetical protein